MVFVVDISRRKRVETALRESEEHYRWSVELSPQLPWTADPGGRLLEIGPRWLELVGLSREDALDHGWTRAVHPDDVGPALERWQACIAAGTPLDTEFRVQSRQGGYRWFRSRSAPRRSADGTILRWYGSAEDVDDHKRADLEMREAAERFRLAIDAAGIGIWDYDCRTGRTGWSSELKTMIGLPETTVPDVALYLSIVHPDDRVAVAAVIGRTPDVTQRRRFENRYRIVRAFDGEERWLAIRGLKICDEEDRPLRVVLTIRDVTEQENAGERVRWATE
ncbi:MAG TPA: PAS domain-containing protein, partial [Kofleriaceae bacterium]|nr:PAS domain-containing protein [Kofleriaceae bacterium]